MFHGPSLSEISGSAAKPKEFLRRLELKKCLVGTLDHFAIDVSKRVYQWQSTVVHCNARTQDADGFRLVLTHKSRKEICLNTGAVTVSYAWSIHQRNYGFRIAFWTCTSCTFKSTDKTTVFPHQKHISWVLQRWNTCSAYPFGRGKMGEQLSLFPLFRLEPWKRWESKQSLRRTPGGCSWCRAHWAEKWAENVISESRASPPKKWLGFAAWLRFLLVVFHQILEAQTHPQCYNHMAKRSVRLVMQPTRWLEATSGCHTSKSGEKDGHSYCINSDVDGATHGRILIAKSSDQPAQSHHFGVACDHGSRSHQGDAIVGIGKVTSSPAVASVQFVVVVVVNAGANRSSAALLPPFEEDASLLLDRQTPVISSQLHRTQHRLHSRVQSFQVLSLCTDQNSTVGLSFQAFQHWINDPLQRTANRLPMPWSLDKTPAFLLVSKTPLKKDVCFFFLRSTTNFSFLGTDMLCVLAQKPTRRSSREMRPLRSVSKARQAPPRFPAFWPVLNR